MDEYPYKNVVALLTQAHSELVPRAMQDFFERYTQQRGGDPPWLDVASERLLQRVRGWNTDEELKAWMQTRASLRSWWALDRSLYQLSGFLLVAKPENVAARRLVAEMVGCPTLLNISRLALRGPVAGP